MAHWSSCAVHNAPALSVGECDCGNDAPRSFEEVREVAMRLFAETQPIAIWHAIDESERFHWMIKATHER